MRSARLALLLLLAPALAAADEPVKRLTADQKKAIRKAVQGDPKARAKIEAIGPLARKAADDVQAKVLGTWRFRGLKSGTERMEIEVGGRTEKYALHVPRGYSPKKRWPLILSLHGAGGNGPQELSFIWGGQLSSWRGFVAAPSGNPPGDQWFPRQTPFVLAVLRDVMERANIDTNRVYVHGFSNGRNGAWYYGESYPGRFAALCTRGGGNPTPNMLVNLRHVPAYVIHGENDTVIKVDSDRRDAKRLEEMGYTVVYTEVPRGGHEPFNRENPKVLDFFREHARDPWPKKLVFATPGRGESFRNLWLEVPANAGPRIEAEVEDGNRIAITGTTRATLWLSDALVDLDQEVIVTLGSREAYRGRPERRLATLVEDLQARFDRQAPAWAKLELR
jgi:predicted esterase